MTERLNQPAYRHRSTHRHSEPAEKPPSTRLLATRRPQAGHKNWRKVKRQVDIDGDRHLRCILLRSEEKRASVE